MPFDEPFDPATPGDNDPISQGDDRIRELKRALNERMLQIVEGWPNTDPLKLRRDALSSSVIMSGTFENRPAATSALQMYYARDRKLLYVAFEDPNTPGQFLWGVSSAVVNLVNDLPDADTVAAGQLYYSYALQSLFVMHSDAWHVIAQAPAAQPVRVNTAIWVPGNAAGTRVTQRASGHVLALRGVNHTTNAQGQILIPFTELTTEGITLANVRSLVANVRISGGGDPLIAVASLGMAEIVISTRYDVTGQPYANAGVDFSLMIGYQK